MVSLQSLNEGIGMVARSWSDLSALPDDQIDEQILVLYLHKHLQ